MRWLQTTIFIRDPLLDWLIAAGIALLVFLGILLLKRLAASRLGRMAERTATGLDDLVLGLARRTYSWLVAIPSAYLGGLYLDLPPRTSVVLKSAAFVAVLLQVALWSSIAVDYWVARQNRRTEGDATTFALAGVLRFILKVVLWSVLLLLALDNLGVDVTTLIAGLGIGGVAVALALQNVLGDLLASLSIALDKPFVIGDTITVDTLTGTVEYIGMKTTRVRSLGGEQIVFSNADLLKSRIRNWAQLKERRVALSFGVPVDAPIDVVERIPAMVRHAIEARDLVRFDRAHYTGFSASSFNFEAVYWILSPEYAVFMDRQQAVNLDLLRAMESEGITLGPTPQTVILQGSAHSPALFPLPSPVPPGEGERDGGFREDRA
ncbi:MAG TPA: mechanosensitive ion channel family protein [Thermoanaerobaculia bacterium]|nr:mechanosensitive ion channel family protein [Thermoanaerobaculia bacterium]